MRGNSCGCSSVEGNVLLLSVDAIVDVVRIGRDLGKLGLNEGMVLSVFNDDGLNVCSLIMDGN